MNSNHRFNRDEISSILKRAAELEHEDHAYDDSEGLSLQELEQISKEVGIHPKYIQRAYNELNVPDEPVTFNIFGGPFTYHHSDSVRGTFTDEEWEDLVAQIRRIHGGIGKTNKLGHTFEWEQRKKEVGYIQISLAPKKDLTKININANYTYYASAIYSAVGVLGFTFLSVSSAFFIKKLGVPLFPFSIAGGLGMLGLLAGVRFYLSRWMEKKRKTYSKLFEQFRKIQGSKVEKESSIEIQDEEHKEIKIDTRSGRQRTT